MQIVKMTIVINKVIKVFKEKLMPFNNITITEDGLEITISDESGSEYKKYYYKYSNDTLIVEPRVASMGKYTIPWFTTIQNINPEEYQETE